MILCRFADQTAVQLPPERRLIGMNRTFMNGACLQIILEKFKFCHISPLAVLFCAIEMFFFFQNHQYERQRLHFTVWYYCSDGTCKLASRSEKTEGARNFKGITLLFWIRRNIYKIY